MSDRQTDIILERIEDKLARFAEAMADVPHDIAILKTKVGGLEADMQVVKAVLKDQGYELTDHESRITRLEGIMPSRG
jgi:hypothetical protein